MTAAEWGVLGGVVLMLGTVFVALINKLPSRNDDADKFRKEILARLDRAEEDEETCRKRCDELALTNNRQQMQLDTYKDRLDRYKTDSLRASAEVRRLTEIVKKAGLDGWDQITQKGANNEQ